MSREMKVAIAFAAFTAVLAGGTTLVFLAIPPAAAQTAANASIAPEIWQWGVIGAVIATAVSSVAAAYAVAKTGSAAIGAIAEKPELFGKLVIYVGLAEGIAIYGLIVSILIINRLA